MSGRDDLTQSAGCHGLTGASPASRAADVGVRRHRARTACPLRGSSRGTPEKFPHHLTRAFTLLETMLAAVLGALVILAAFALFATVQRSDKRSQIKMEENLELAHAHTVIARVFQNLLMSDQPRPGETETNEFLDQDDDRNDPDRAELEDEDLSGTRMSIQPDINNPIVMLTGREDRQRRARSQLVQLTLRDTPVPGEGAKSAEQQLIDELIHERIMARAAETINKRAIGSSRRSENSSAAMSEAMQAEERLSGDRGTGGSGGSKTSTGKSLSLRERSDAKRRKDVDGTGEAANGLGLRGDEDDDEQTASERLAEEEEERPRAPGVRGVLEILPDGAETGASGFTGMLSTEPAAVRPTARELDAQERGVQTYSLWWRELPAIDINGDNVSLAETLGGEDANKDRSRRRDKEGTEGGLGEQIDREVQRLAEASDAGGKRVRLLSGLTTCHWTAFRGRKERDKITATFDAHLPAFVELELVTAGGRRENWIFDVSWTNGPEPGSVLAETPDALSGGLAGAGEQNGPDLNGDTGGNGTDDGKGNGNTNGKGKNTGKNKGGKPGDKGSGDNKTDEQRAIEAVQDAIRRATGGNQGGGRK